MRKLLLVLVTVGLVVPAGSASSADSSTPVSAYAASLAPAGERPVPKGVRAGVTGLFDAIVTRSGGKTTLSWTLSFNGLTGTALAAHIHTGKPGQVGAIAVTLCQPCKSGARGQKTLDAKVATAIAGGNTYVNVHTKANPGGEIRGQLGTSHAFAAALDAAGETPAPKGVPEGAKGAFSAIVVDVGPRPLIVWSLDFDGLSGQATASHIHLGAAGTAGPVVLALCGPCTSGAHGRKLVDAKLAAALEKGNVYVNVHTAANPGGEIRGQLAHAAQGVGTVSNGLGNMLVDDRGKTLYMWEGDKSGQSACYGRCAVFWPPAFAYGAPVAAPGTQAALLGLTKRTDGTSMLTYAGHPVYGFLPDAQPGDVKGQGSNGFGAPWWVLDAGTGQAITTKPS
jgi:predicted lipoprotein with Yx(FWY)xxD motif